MEFSVLGSLQVSTAAEAVTIGAAGKRRLVLAVLLARAGQPVPTDTLVDAVWGEHQPASARRNLQLYLHQLRRMLGDDLITPHGDGYAIDPGDALDATRFRQLAADGARSLDAGDPATAERTLRAGLDLWRGPAFAEFVDCRLVADEAQRLELLRVETYERWAEARLASGATGQLAADLTELCKSHPYRESLRALLMRALYQTGRQAEALAVFRDARAQLVGELGVEPGPALVRLHEAILRGDAALLPAASTVAVPLSPRQLPAPPQTFTGRVDELAGLVATDDASTVVISAIDGMAGVGKTALAVHVAHRIADRYPDGQLFIDLHGYTQGVAPVAPADALDRLLRTLGVAGTQVPAGIDERAALYRTRLADRRMLIVLDNAASDSQVVPLLPGAVGCLVLVTSRRRLAGLDHTHTLSLDVLPVADAVALLRQTAGEGRLSDQPPDLLAELVELCGRLPLAIRIAAARLRSRPTWSVSHVVQRLRDQRRRLAELEAGQRSVTAALDVSYQHLGADQQHTYRSLGLHPGAEIDPCAAAALLDSTLDHARRMLDQLLDAHLLLEPVAGRYRFHDLVRAHAVHTAAAQQTEPAGLDRLLDHYRHTASLAMDAAYPLERELRPKVPPAKTPPPDLPDVAAALEWLDTELPNLLAAARFAAEQGRHAHTSHLSTILNVHLRVRSRYRDAETLSRQALLAARATGCRSGELTALNSLGWANRRQGRHGPAIDCYQQALRLARAAGHRSGEIEALQGLGDTFSLQVRYEQATDCYQRALRLARAAGHRTGEIEALFGLGDIYSLDGRYVQAAGRFGQALELARAAGHRAGELNALTGLGQVHRLLGEYARAADHYTQALQLAHAAGHRGVELNALTGLGDIRRREGRHARAGEHYQRLLDLAEESGDRNSQFEAWHGLGRLRRATGEPKAAISHHERALTLARDLDQPVDEVRAHDGLAHAHHALHQDDQAGRHWRQALDILSRLGVDRTEDQETTAAAIRTHLAGLDLP